MVLITMCFSLTHSLPEHLLGAWTQYEDKTKTSQPSVVHARFPERDDKEPSTHANLDVLKQEFGSQHSSHSMGCSQYARS